MLIGRHSFIRQSKLSDVAGRIDYIKMPQFLCDEMQDYLKMLYEPKEDERIFTISKSYLHHEMNRGSKVSGVKRIRVHDLRHSHVSLLINMGFTVLAIAD